MHYASHDWPPKERAMVRVFPEQLLAIICLDQSLGYLAEVPGKD